MQVIVAANCLIETAAARLVGGFDASFPGAGAEDTGFGPSTPQGRRDRVELQRRRSNTISWTTWPISIAGSSATAAASGTWRTSGRSI